VYELNPGRVHIYGKKEQGDDVSVAPPSPYLEVPDDVLVERAFGFLDLCGFSEFTVEAGPPAAFEELRQFRSLVRIVASTRGVRIASWLGDGAMLVGVNAGAVAAAVVEVVARSGHPARGSVTQGQALLFEGDDHIGGCVNLASRLCGAAEANQVLTVKSLLDSLPGWVMSTSVGTMTLRGLDDEMVYNLTVVDDVADVMRFGFPSGAVPVVKI
jgi:adenylate cyclase